MRSSRPFTGDTQDQWQTTGLLVHFNFLFPLCLWRRAVTAWKSTNDKTDSTVQSQCLGKREQRMNDALLPRLESVPIELHAESDPFSSC